MDPKHDRAAFLYANGERQVDIAHSLGVAGLTVWRWLQRPEVKRRVEEYQADWRNYQRVRKVG